MHDSVQAALHATRCEGVTSALLIALKPSTWLAGRDAGGDDARTARERLARPPAGTALAPPSGSHPESTLRGTSAMLLFGAYKLSRNLFVGDEAIDFTKFFSL